MLFYKRRRQSDVMIEAVEDEADWAGKSWIPGCDGRAGEGGPGCWPRRWRTAARRWV